MSLTIRHGTIADIETIIRFNLLLARETENRELDERTLRSGVTALLEDPLKGTYYLAESDGTVIGQTMVTSEWSDWRDGTFLWLQSVYVATSHRGTGVFQKIYKQISEEARAAGNICGIRLYVDKQNHPAQATYVRLGMSPSEYDMYEHEFTHR